MFLFAFKSSSLFLEVLSISLSREKFLGELKIKVMRLPLFDRERVLF